MTLDYDAQLEVWRARMAAKPVARYVHIFYGVVRRPARQVQPHALARIEYDQETEMPRYEDFSQEAA